MSTEIASNDGKREYILAEFRCALTKAKLALEPGNSSAPATAAEPELKVAGE